MSIGCAVEAHAITSRQSLAPYMLGLAGHAAEPAARTCQNPATLRNHLRE